MYRRSAARPAPCLPMFTSGRKQFTQASMSLASTAIAYRIGSCWMASCASMRSTRSASPGSVTTGLRPWSGREDDFSPSLRLSSHAEPFPVVPEALAHLVGRNLVVGQVVAPRAVPVAAVALVIQPAADGGCYPVEGQAEILVDS